MRYIKYFIIHIKIMLLLCGLLFTVNSYAQISKSISSITNTPPLQNSELTFNIDLFQSNMISRIVFFYKPFGGSDFKSREAVLSGAKAVIVIPKEDVKPPELEYYVTIEFKDGSSESYPLDYQKTNVPVNLKIDFSFPEDDDVILLSPEPGFRSSSAELLFSISLLHASSEVQKDSTKIFIDNFNVTDRALLMGDLINYCPDNFEPKIQSGVHTLKVVLYDTLNREFHTFRSNFTIISEDEASIEKTQLFYHLDATGEIRNENISARNTFYNNLGVNFTGELSDWKMSAGIYLTSEDKSYLQPYNRYSLSIQNNFAQLAVGDIMPRFPSLILDGKRVRGVYGDVKAGSVEVKSVYGEVTRGTDGRLLQMFTASDAPLSSDVINIDSLKYGYSKGQVVLGAYKRDLLAVRASIGSENSFIWGLSYLHAKDQISSIEFGSAPKENLVLGTDFSWSLDNNNIVLAAQGAFSLNNNDISTGALSDELIDSLFKKDGGLNADPQKVKDIKKIFGKFITVNQYISPLNPAQLPTLAAESSISINYLANSLKASYIYRGNDFQSFGQQYTRTDVAGLNLSDRARLLSDKIFLSVSYEDLRDNLQNTKFATTNYKTFNSSISVFPRNEYPNVVFGYNRYNNDNNLVTTDTNKMNYIVNDVTNRYYTQISYDFQLGVKQQASLSYSISNRDDNSPANYDVNNTAVFMQLNSFWDQGYNTFVNISVNNSKIKEYELNYTGFSIGGSRSFLEKKLDISADINPIFGDLKRVAYELSAQYSAYTNLMFTLQFRFLTYPNQPNDIIAGLTTHFGLN
jgi:hypothetical protein